MKISTRGRYGLRAMVDLAENQNSKAIPIREISERQNISEQYLEQIFARLRKAGLVKSVRGAYGGYKLNHPPGEITVGEIIRTLEGSIAPVDCVGGDNECKLSEDCVTRGLWELLRDSIDNILASITLKDLRDKSFNLNRRE